VVAVVLAVVIAGYGAGGAYEQGRTAAPEQGRRYGEQADLKRVLGAWGDACPGIATAPDQVPAVAWEMSRPLAAVGLWPAAGRVWVVSATTPVPPSDRRAVRYRDAHWWVVAMCR
jgi:hypothetical protein